MIPSWHLRAACRDADPNLFYAEQGDPGWAVHRAKLICATCPVTEQCLAYALERGERFGVWGGLSERERRRLKRGRRVA